MDFSLGAAALVNGRPTTWANRPAANSVPVGTRIIATDLGNRQFYSNGTLWLPAGSPVLAQSGVASSVTGTTAETTLASIVIPGGLMGPDGVIRINAGTTQTSNANAKTYTVRLGGVSVVQLNAANGAAASIAIAIANRNSQASQYVRNTSHAATTGVGTTVSVNTAVDQTLTISATLANAADTATLESYTVEVLPA